MSTGLRRKRQKTDVHDTQELSFLQAFLKSIVRPAFPRQGDFAAPEISTPLVEPVCRVVGGTRIEPDGAVCPVTGFDLDPTDQLCPQVFSPVQGIYKKAVHIPSRCRGLPIYLSIVDIARFIDRDDSQQEVCFGQQQKHTPGLYIVFQYLFRGVRFTPTHTRIRMPYHLLFEGIYPREVLQRCFPKQIHRPRLP